MKNKVFSLMAVVIFTTSLMSAAPINGILNIVSCTDVAVSVQNKLEKKGFSAIDANEAADAAYDACVDNGGSPN